MLIVLKVLGVVAATGLVILLFAACVSLSYFLVRVLMFDMWKGGDPP